MISLILLEISTSVLYRNFTVSLFEKQFGQRFKPLVSFFFFLSLMGFCFLIIVCLDFVFIVFVKIGCCLGTWVFSVCSEIRFVGGKIELFLWLFWKLYYCI